MTTALTHEGYQISEAGDGRDGLDLISNHRPELVLVDLMMPHMGGDAVVATMRSHRATRLTPIIVITARDDRATQRRLMEMGADDFISKPVTVEELIGAVSAQLRKARWQVEDRRQGRRGVEYTFGEWRFNTVVRRLTAPSGQQHILPFFEAELLRALIEHRGEVMSRDALFRRIGRTPSSPFDRRIDLLISRIRHRFDAEPNHPKMLKTVRGAGYVFDFEVTLLRD